MRATSSIRSTSRVTSVAAQRRARVTSSPSAAGSVAKSSAPQDLGLALARDRHAEDRLDALLAQADRRGARPGSPPTSIVPGQRASRRSSSIISARRRPPARACTARAAGPSRSARRPRCAGRAPRRCGGCSGRSRSRPPSARACVSGCDLRARAAHHAGDRRRPLGVLDHAPSRRRACASGRRASRTCSPSRGAAHRQAPARDAVEVEGVQRLAGRAASRSW